MLGLTPLVLDNFSRNIYVKFPDLFSLFYLLPDFMSPIHTDFPHYPEVEYSYEIFCKLKWLKVTVPCFLKVCNMPLHFYQRPTLVLPGFAN